jgi:hypothetical protein
MPTLTADEITAYRQLVGDECTPENFTDAIVQSLYDRAYVFDLDAGTTEAVTVVYMLRRLLGLARTKVDLNGELQIEMRSQYFKHLMEMLKYWEGIAGAGGFSVSGIGRLSVGKLNLDTDWTETDSEAEWLGL